MKLIERKNQNRRDFTGVYECEHCGHKETYNACYDDDNFNRNVTPQWECPKCKKKSPATTIPVGTKYAADEVV